VSISVNNDTANAHNMYQHTNSHNVEFKQFIANWFIP